MYKIIIEASGLEYYPKLVESGNGWATIYGQQVEEFDCFYEALENFNDCCKHAAKCSGIFEESDYE